MVFFPSFFKIFISNYTRSDFFNDLISGVVVGIIALPMALAFAIASGVAPEQGIYTAIVAGILIGFFGGSRYQVSGPTGAFVVIILSIVNEHGISGLALATLMSGFFLVLLGFSKLGSLVKYMPRPIIVGFTSGIALIIFSTQIGNLLGIPLSTKSESLVGTYFDYFSHIEKTNLYSVLISALTIVLTIFIPYFFKKIPFEILSKIPGSLVALIISTVVAFYFNFNLDTIGSKFGQLPSGLPKISLPNIDLNTVVKLIPAAFSITLLGAVESLLSATIADNMTKTKHDSNTELIGQGIGNMFSPLFGGIPATGAIVRTASNVRFGAKSPVSTIIHGITIFCFVMFFSKIISFIPMAALAGILVVVSWNMSEIHAFKKTLTTTRSDTLVLIITFLLTVFTNLVTAIEIGLILSALALIYQTSRTSTFELYNAHDLNLDVEGLIDNGTIGVVQFNGSLFFGSVDKFRELVESISQNDSKHKVIIFDMKHVDFIDASGIHELDQAFDLFKKHGIKVFICHLGKQPYHAVHNTHLSKKLMRHDVHGTLHHIIDHLKNLKSKKSV